LRHISSLIIDYPMLVVTKAQQYVWKHLDGHFSACLGSDNGPWIANAK